MATRGIKYVDCYGVDNALVRFLSLWIMCMVCQKGKKKGRTKIPFLPILSWSRKKIVIFIVLSGPPKISTENRWCIVESSVEGTKLAYWRDTISSAFPFTFRIWNFNSTGVLNYSFVYWSIGKFSYFRGIVIRFLKAGSCSWSNFLGLFHWQRCFGCCKSCT